MMREWRRWRLFVATLWALAVFFLIEEEAKADAESRCIVNIVNDSGKVISDIKRYFDSENSIDVFSSTLCGDYESSVIVSKNSIYVKSMNGASASIYLFDEKVSAIRSRLTYYPKNVIDVNDVIVIFGSRYVASDVKYFVGPSYDGKDILRIPEKLVARLLEYRGKLGRRVFVRVFADGTVESVVVVEQGGTNGSVE